MKNNMIYINFKLIEKMTLNNTFYINDNVIYDYEITSFNPSSFL